MTSAIEMWVPLRRVHNPQAHLLVLEVMTGVTAAIALLAASTAG
jgi:hypothetical protein